MIRSSVRRAIEHVAEERLIFHAVVVRVVVLAVLRDLTTRIVEDCPHNPGTHVGQQLVGSLCGRAVSLAGTDHQEHAVGQGRKTASAVARTGGVSRTRRSKLFESSCMSACIRAPLSRFEAFVGSAPQVNNVRFFTPVGRSETMEAGSADPDSSKAGSKVSERAPSGPHHCPR